MPEPFTGGRWQPGSLQPSEVYSPPGYSASPRGEVRRAGLHDQAGRLLGHVWTDGKEAAGFLPDEQAGSAGVRAAGHVFVVLRACRERDVPASEVLDPALYEPAYRLVV